MASPGIKLLDGPRGYLRWKESMLLRAHTLRVAHVLFEDPPGADDEAAAKRWAHDDAICRGHILTTLSDRLLPDYARHATARAVWEAVARTYDVETRHVWHDKFMEFSFDEGGHFLEQLAHAEALGVTAQLSDATVASYLTWKLPEVVSTGVVTQSIPDNEGMSFVWEITRRVVSRLKPAHLWKTREDFLAEEEVNLEDQKQQDEVACWNCGMPGHIARNCGFAGNDSSRKRRAC